ncbi:MAG: DeoR/GlpR family DNA-binding transcription regulator [Verrucomicrobiota bacterium JB022]|nr:DeoR/GlpR family DNA-binding transcription regulator [Verrucomicrobiota bacterium JB022]
MLASQRHQTILETLQLEGAVRTTLLAERLGVTEETVRKDLLKLEETGKLKRTHGGAVLDLALDRELDYQEREGQQIKEKAKISRRALQLIKPRSCIFLDASSTALALARLLPDQELTVITHAQKIVTQLSHLSQVNLILLGGNLDRRSLSFTGPATMDMARRYRIDQIFFSCRGLHRTRGLSEATEPQAAFKRFLFEQADEVILLADHYKFGLSSSYYFAGCDQLDVVVTDQPPPEEFRSALGTARIEVGG